MNDRSDSIDSNLFSSPLTELNPDSDLLVGKCGYATSVEMFVSGSLAAKKKRNKQTTKQTRAREMNSLERR